MESKTISIHKIIPIVIEKLNEDGKVIITVTGNSMLPFMVDHITEVTLVKVSRPFKRKDIAFYKGTNGSWILHRILRVKNDTLIICGDGLRSLEYINQQEVIAIVSKIKHQDKEISVNNHFYKFKVGIWLLLRPLRRYLLSIYRRLH